MFSKHSLWSIAGGAVPAITAVIAIPILIAALGYELFAIVSLVISLTIFFFVYDFGVGRAMTFFVPKLEHDSGDKTGELVGSALFAALVLGGLATALIYLIAPYIVQHWLGIRSELARQTVCAFQITALGILPGVIANTLKGLLEGRSGFREANLCKIFSGASIFLAPLLVIACGSKDLIHISAVIVVSRYLALMLYIFYAARLVNLAAIRLKPAILSIICNYGAWAALSGFIATMFVYGDRFIVARYLSPEELSVYIASQDILIRYLLIPWSIAVILMPVFSANSLSTMEIARLYRQQQKHIGMLSLGVLILVISIAVIAPPFLVGFNIPLVARNVVIVQVIGVFFCAISQLPLVYLYARGKPRLITMVYGVEAIIYMMFAPFVFSHYGISGACIVWSGRLVLEYLMLRFLAERLIK